MRANRYISSSVIDPPILNLDVAEGYASPSFPASPRLSALPRFTVLILPRPRANLFLFWLRRFRQRYHGGYASREQVAEMVKDEELIELSFPRYWDERYTAKQNAQAELESFEWFRSFPKLKPFFDEHLPPPPSGCDCHILQLGCGNSVPAPFVSVPFGFCLFLCCCSPIQRLQLTSVCRH